jgi:deoxyribose-phosphate aldolase
MYLTLMDFKKRLEYSLCQHFADNGDVREFCNKAMAAEVGVICVNPVWVSLASTLVSGKDIELSGNVGFPFGSHHTKVKVLETQRAVKEGATQIDVVINVGALRSGEDSQVEDDIRAVVQAADGRIVKTIIETWVLNRDEKERACKICESAGAGLVKTTTGVRTQYLQEFSDGPVGAVTEDIVLMRKVLSPHVRIKASGGIYTLDIALELLQSGADQLGVSRGEKLAKEFRNRYGEGIELNDIGFRL